jgi:hypothetical protein
LTRPPRPGNWTPAGRVFKATGIADRYLRRGEELPPLVADMSERRARDTMPGTLRRMLNRLQRTGVVSTGVNEGIWRR